jgi:integration host factor subunit beta
MNKSELTETLAQKQNLTNSEAAKIINTLLNSMSEALGNGENVEIRGFGSFSVREYDSYTGRNPKTGEKVTVKPKKLPYFKVCKGLREAVNGHQDK